MGEIRFVGTGETRGYTYLVCKNRSSQAAISWGCSLHCVIQFLTIPAHFLEPQRVRLLAKSQFTGFFLRHFACKTSLEKNKSETLFFSNM